jgi:hypothetical protein
MRRDDMQIKNVKNIGGRLWAALKEWAEIGANHQEVFSASPFRNGVALDLMSKV